MNSTTILYDTITIFTTCTTSKNTVLGVLVEGDIFSRRDTLHHPFECLQVAQVGIADPEGGPEVARRSEVGFRRGELEARRAALDLEKGVRSVAGPVAIWNVRLGPRL